MDFYSMMQCVQFPSCRCSRFSTSCLDEMESFMESILPFIRCLSSASKMKLRVFIQQVIYEADRRSPLQAVDDYTPAKSICSLDSDELFYWGLIPMMRNLDSKEKLAVRTEISAEVLKFFTGEYGGDTKQRKASLDQRNPSPQICKFSKEDQLLYINYLLNKNARSGCNDKANCLCDKDKDNYKDEDKNNDEDKNKHKDNYKDKDDYVDIDDDQNKVRDEDKIVTMKPAMSAHPRRTTSDNSNASAEIYLFKRYSNRNDSVASKNETLLTVDAVIH